VDLAEQAERRAYGVLACRQERQPDRRAGDLPLGVQRALDDGGVGLGEQRRRQRGETVPQFAGLPGAPAVQASMRPANSLVHRWAEARMQPAAPSARIGDANASSPASTAKSPGRLAISMMVSWSMAPAACLTPAIPGTLASGATSDC